MLLGPPAPSQGATRRAIVSGRAYDARPARARERSRDLCVRARLWRQARLPLQGWHEVEAPAGHMCAAAPTQNGDVEVPAGQGVETGGAAGGGAACEVDAAGANATVDIVIAAHSQPVASMVRALVGALPSGVAPTVHVYAKGPALDGKGARRQLEAALARTAAPRARLVLHTGMENVGRCDHTYLHHIVENYDSLADATLFVKDTTAAHSHLGVFAKVLTFARRLPRSFRFWCARVFSAASSNFTMDGYSSELCHSDRRFSNARVVSKRLAHCYANESFVRSPLRPLGAWMDTHAVRRVRWAPQRLRVPFCAGGTFAASRAGVRSTPRATYEALRRALSKADNLEEGHYMERSWSSVMSGGAVSVERSRLVVYTVEGGGGERPGVAPCNRSVTAKMDEGAAPGGLSWKAVRGRGLPVACLCFGSTDAFLDGCRRRGWRAKNIFTGASAAAAEAARLRRTPHARRRSWRAPTTRCSPTPPPTANRPPSTCRCCSTASMPSSPAPPRRSRSTTPAAAGRPARGGAPDDGRRRALRRGVGAPRRGGRRGRGRRARPRRGGRRGRGRRGDRGAPRDAEAGGRRRRARRVVGLVVVPAQVLRARLVGRSDSAGEGEGEGGREAPGIAESSNRILRESERGTPTRQSGGPGA